MPSKYEGISIGPFKLHPGRNNGCNIYCNIISGKDEEATNIHLTVTRIYLKLVAASFETYINNSAMRANSYTISSKVVQRIITDNSTYPSMNLRQFSYEASCSINEAAAVIKQAMTNEIETPFKTIDLDKAQKWTICKSIHPISAHHNGGVQMRGVLVKIGGWPSPTATHFVDASIWSGKSKFQLAIIIDVQRKVLIKDTMILAKLGPDSKFEEFMAKNSSDIELAINELKHNSTNFPETNARCSHTYWAYNGKMWSADPEDLANPDHEAAVAIHCQGWDGVLALYRLDDNISLSTWANPPVVLRDLPKDDYAFGILTSSIEGKKPKRKSK